MEKSSTACGVANGTLFRRAAALYSALPSSRPLMCYPEMVGADCARTGGVSLCAAVLADASEPLRGNAGPVDAYDQPIRLDHIGRGLLPPANSG